VHAIPSSETLQLSNQAVRLCLHQACSMICCPQKIQSRSGWTVPSPEQGVGIIMQRFVMTDVGITVWLKKRWAHLLWECPRTQRAFQTIEDIWKKPQKGTLTSLGWGGKQVRETFKSRLV
jgi:hypothetical protein